VLNHREAAMKIKRTQSLRIGIELIHQRVMIVVEGRIMPTYLDPTFKRG